MPKIEKDLLKVKGSDGQWHYAPTTEWQTFYIIANIPVNNYLYDITMCFYSRGITHYIDWIAAYDITGANFGHMTFGARATATAIDVLSGKAFYKNGKKYYGTIKSQDGKVVTPSTKQQLAVEAYKYTSGNVYVAGDSNLTAGNIKKGVSIFGVAGTYADVAKVYVAHNITPAKLTPSSSDTWTSCAQITMIASAIKKLLDTSNSAETLSSDLYGKTPNAVVATISSIWNLPTHPKFVSHFECYGNGYDSYTYYNGASNGYEYISLSSTDKSRTFKCLADNTNGTVIGQLFLSSNYNMSTSNSYDVYLIY